MFVIGAILGVVRAAHDDEYKRVSKLINVAILSGSFTFSVCSFVMWGLGGSIDDWQLYIPLAIFVGGLGKTQDKWTRDLSELLYTVFCEILMGSLQRFLKREPDVLPRAEGEEDTHGSEG